MAFHSSLLACPHKIQTIWAYLEALLLGKEDNVGEKKAMNSMNSGWYVHLHQQVSGRFPILGLWIFGALYLWGREQSFVSYIQNYRTNKWASDFPRLCRSIWVSTFSFVVTHSGFATSEWASEPWLYNEPSSVPMAKPQHPFSPVAILMP